jgi:hypothetical protein
VSSEQLAVNSYQLAVTMRAGAYAKRYFQILRQRLKIAFGMPARSALKPAGGCKALFSNPKAEAEDCFRYAGAERIETRWRAQSAFFRLKARSKDCFQYAGAERIETRWRVQSAIFKP